MSDTPRPTLVLLPGLLCDGALYRPQIEALREEAEILVADLTAHDTMAAMARSVLALAPPTFALAGLSMGGYVAFEIMRQAPERVTRLALLDTAATPDTPEQTEQRLAFMSMAETGDFRGVTARLLPRLIHASRLQDQALAEVIFEMARHVGRTGFIRQQRAIIARPDSRPGLSHITCPTLVVCGRQDALTPLERAREIATDIPDARLVVIEECGHLTTLERPAEVTAVMRSWLFAE